MSRNYQPIGLSMRMEGPSDRQELRLKMSPPITNSIEDVVSNAKKLAQGRTYRTLNDSELKEIEQYLTE